MQNQDVPFSTPAARSDYERLVKQWGDGDQSGVERQLQGVLQKNPKDLRLLFFVAVLVRSRFDIEGAAPVFAALAQRAAKTRQGEAAKAMLAIDKQQDVVANFNRLGDLAMKSQSTDPVLVWLFAIAARTLRQNKAGIMAYTLLLKKIKKGSSLVHQTFANMLDGEARHTEALVHRKLAVQLEPAPWSYDGLALTLFRLKRTDEALKLRAELQKRSPDFAVGWANWGNELAELGRYKEAAEKLDKAVALEPGDPAFRADRDRVRAKAR